MGSKTKSATVKVDALESIKPPQSNTMPTTSRKTSLKDRKIAEKAKKLEKQKTAALKAGKRKVLNLASFQVNTLNTISPPKEVLSDPTPTKQNVALASITNAGVDGLADEGYQSGVQSPRGQASQILSLPDDALSKGPGKYATSPKENHLKPVTVVPAPKHSILEVEFRLPSWFSPELPVGVGCSAHSGIPAEASITKSTIRTRPSQRSLDDLDLHRRALDGLITQRSTPKSWQPRSTEVDYHDADRMFATYKRHWLNDPEKLNAFAEKHCTTASMLYRPAIADQDLTFEEAMTCDCEVITFMDLAPKTIMVANWKDDDEKSMPMSEPANPALSEGHESVSSGFKSISIEELFASTAGTPINVATTQNSRVTTELKGKPISIEELFASAAGKSAVAGPVRASVPHTEFEGFIKSLFDASSHGSDAKSTTLSSPPFEWKKCAPVHDPAILKVNTRSTTMETRIGMSTTTNGSLTHPTNVSVPDAYNKSQDSCSPQHEVPDNLSSPQTSCSGGLMPHTLFSNPPTPPPFSHPWAPECTQYRGELHWNDCGANNHTPFSLPAPYGCLPHETYHAPQFAPGPWPGSDSHLLSQEYFSFDNYTPKLDHSLSFGNSASFIPTWFPTGFQQPFEISIQSSWLSVPV